MSKSKFITLDKKIEELKAITSELDIFSVSNRMFHEMIMFTQKAKRISLNSPSRQAAYLLGIMVSQKNSGAKELTDYEYSRISKLLNDIFSKYLKAYLPDKSEMAKGVTQAWSKPRTVSLPVFISYFFESQKIATDEIRKDILETNDKFESEIAKHFGLSHKDMISITDQIGELLQLNINSIYALVSKLQERQSKLSDISADKYDDFLEETRKECRPLLEDFNKSTNEMATFKFDDIKNIDSNTLDKFKSLYVINKGEGPFIKYITDENIIDESPIITTDGCLFTLASINQVYFAIQRQIESFFKSSKQYADKYRKFRDRKLECDTNEAFKILLPTNSIIIESVYENDKSSNEHDIIIKVDRTILVIEAKAAPRREPLTDPNRAFTRIRDDFKRKSGIQGGCDQAIKLKSLLEKNETTILYDKKGNELLTLNKADFDDVFCICVTKDEFGLLATDLSILLEKPHDIDYPWVVKITDLKYYFSCLKHIGKDWDYFINYLRRRIELMGCLCSSDELEIAGHYLKYDGFGKMKKGGAILTFDISESDIFDEIHTAQIEGQEFPLEKSIAEYSELNRRAIFNTYVKKKRTLKSKEQKISRRRNRK